MNNTIPSACGIEAPCKINLHLGIGEKRADGFHSLESLFAGVALGDSLLFTRTGADGGGELSVNWEIPGEEIPPEKNLVFRALSLFREKTGYTEGLRVRLDKRVPSGAGLGGGSSDAASTLLALNALSGAALRPEELAEMAALLGSDVPFFLTGGIALVSGRGEVIEPLGLPPALSRTFRIVLVKPGFSSATAPAFRLLDSAREGRVFPALRERLSRERLSRERLIRALGEDPAGWPFYNDFLPVFLESGEGENRERAGVYRGLFETLKSAGAVFTGLSGSGSACFGVFRSAKMAENAKKCLSMQGNFARMTFFLASGAIPVLEY